jgi:hypothetical protein
MLSISRPQKRIWIYYMSLQYRNKSKSQLTSPTPAQLPAVALSAGHIVYPISFVKIFASIVTVSEQQKARPGSTAAHKSSTFYWIELKP